MTDPIRLYSRAQVYQLDKLAINADAQSARQLMGRAAQACWNALSERWPNARRLVVFAGSGNNGGDAFGVAALALQAALEVDCFLIGEMARQSPASTFFRRQFEAAGGKVSSWHGQLPDCDIIVDGLLGIGLDRALNEKYQQLINCINAAPARRVAIDIPSGLNADTGSAMPIAVQADLTVSFIGRKLGCYLADGGDYCGKRIFDDLGLSAASRCQVEALAQSLQASQIQLPERPNNAYKNTLGHVLVVGGAPGLSGAVRLAAYAALRSGAGLVSACVHPDMVPVVAAGHPEIMVSGWDQLQAMLQRASLLLVGPGLGRSKAALEMLQQLSMTEQPMVIDADALDSEFLGSLKRRDFIITPHPGEAARLLQSSSRQIQQDRVLAISQLLELSAGVVILKGAGSLIADRSSTMHLCTHGHPGMATAGMGDVLAGMVAGYRAQGLGALSAAQTAVLIHALAAEHFATGQDAASLIASDVIARIGHIVKRIRSGQII